MVFYCADVLCYTVVLCGVLLHVVRCNVVWHVQEIVVKEQEGGKCGGSSGVAHYSIA